MDYVKAIKETEESLNFVTKMIETKQYHTPQLLDDLLEKQRKLRVRLEYLVDQLA